ncbi:MAG TPA: ferritin family protein [Rectinemataceae bacterium]|nr:ferritin family protein [Rectinemataceae bacterium]
MANEHIIDAIKTGMKGEYDSVTVYEGAAAAAEGAVRDFFLERAEEEKRHYNWLLSYYKEISAGKEPEKDLVQDEGPAASPIITPDFLKRIGTSRQLTAAIATAILLEATAVRHYQKCAEESLHPALVYFYEKLAAWEDRHYHDLLIIQEESERYFWDANNWQPF